MEAIVRGGALSPCSGRKEASVALLLVSVVLASRSSLRPFAARCALSGLGEAHAGRELAGLDQAPQRDQKLTHERDDQDLRHPPLGVAEARPVPLGERAL